MEQKVFDSMLKSGEFEQMFNENKINELLSVGNLSKKQVDQLVDLGKKMSKSELKKRQLELSKQPGYKEHILVPLIQKILAEQGRARDPKTGRYIKKEKPEEQQDEQDNEGPNIGPMSNKSNKIAKKFAPKRMNKMFLGNKTNTAKSLTSKVNAELYSKVGQSTRPKLRKGDGAATVAAKIYSILKNDITEKKLAKELKQNFGDTKLENEKRRHKELMEALSHTGANKNVKSTEKDDDIVSKGAKELILGLGLGAAALGMAGAAAAQTTPEPPSPTPSPAPPPTPPNREQAQKEQDELERQSAAFEERIRLKAEQEKEKKAREDVERRRAEQEEKQREDDRLRLKNEADAKSEAIVEERRIQRTNAEAERQREIEDKARQERKLKEEKAAEDERNREKAKSESRQKEREGDAARAEEEKRAAAENQIRQQREQSAAESAKAEARRLQEIKQKEEADKKRQDDEKRQREETERKQREDNQRQQTEQNAAEVARRRKQKEDEDRRQREETAAIEAEKARIASEVEKKRKDDEASALAEKRRQEFEAAREVEIERRRQVTEAAAERKRQEEQKTTERSGSNDESLKNRHGQPVTAVPVPEPAPIAPRPQPARPVTVTPTPPREQTAVPVPRVEEQSSSILKSAKDKISKGESAAAGNEYLGANQAPKDRYVWSDENSEEPILTSIIKKGEGDISDSGSKLKLITYDKRTDPDNHKKYPKGKLVWEKRVNFEKDLTDMTIREVNELQKKRSKYFHASGAGSAMGKYQFMPATLLAQAEAVLGTNYMDTVFSEDVQELIMNKHTMDNAKILGNITSELTLRLAHFNGPDYARAVKKAFDEGEDDKLLKDFLTPAEIRANHYLVYKNNDENFPKTIGEYKNELGYLSRKLIPLQTLKDLSEQETKDRKDKIIIQQTPRRSSSLNLENILDGLALNQMSSLNSSMKKGRNMAPIILVNNSTTIIGSNKRETISIPTDPDHNVYYAYA